ncbi:MAG TPA: DUF4233 domain-containing protein [Jatrophihabitantaceae bacterium]|nr:DUF4233 domain-containing protein [Jatrophihabitantaceae bacterium]
MTVEQPTPEQIAERAVRADRATRSAIAGVLGLEALVVLLVPRAIRFTVGLGVTRTTLLIALAVLLVFAAAGVRRSWGIGFGSALQVPFVLTGVWVVSMFVVGVVFAAIWLYLLNLRHELVGTPTGVRMLYS